MVKTMQLKPVCKKLMLSFLILLLILVAIITYILMLPDFGRLPKGERLDRINASSHFIDGTFVPLETTETHLKKGFIAGMYSFLFEEKPDLKPSKPVPTVKTDLKSLDINEDLIVWMGHSSFYLQLGGKRILVDPIFSGHSSPFKAMMKAFPGSDVYTADDMPAIDALLISHDHWDHLDYETVTALKDKVGVVLTGLGSGEHFEYWGYDKSKIIEKDWDEAPLELGDLKITITPTRHFSGRFLKRNPTLPVSFVFDSPRRKVFYSGDGAFGKHFKDIAQKYGPFDFAIMEDGQYNEQWHFVHMFPEEMLEASKILGARYVLPVHNSKFILAEHRWDEPLAKASKEAPNYGIMLQTPKIGDKVDLADPKANERWWEELE